MIGPVTYNTYYFCNLPHRFRYFLTDDTELPVQGDDLGMGAKGKLYNSWSDPKTKGTMPIDMVDDKPIVSEDFKKAMMSKKVTNALSGVDICDVPECYCKAQGGEESTLSLSRCQTPQLSESGSVTPKESGMKNVKV